MYIIAFKINRREANKFKAEHKEERNAKIEDAKKERREKGNTNQKGSKGRQERKAKKEGENV